MRQNRQPAVEFVDYIDAISLVIERLQLTRTVESVTVALAVVSAFRGVSDSPPVEEREREERPTA